MRPSTLLGKVLVVESEQLRFPELGDSIFAKGENWELNACVVRYSQEDAPLPWTGYIEGYRSAANRLFTSVNLNTRDQDRLLYPILFVWQHHTEIILKHILAMLSYLLNQEIPSKIRKSHRIETLWNELLKMAPNLTNFMDSTREGAENLQAATCIVKEFSGIFTSNNQEGARYPISLKSAPSLRKSFTGLNLEMLDITMSKLSNLLDCIYQELLVRVEKEIEFPSRTQKLSMQDT